VRWARVSSALVVAVFVARSAHAALPVIDATANTFLGISISKEAALVAGQIRQLSNDVVKITNLVATLNAVRSGNIFAAGALISQLNDMGLTTPLSADAQGFVDALQGLGMASLNLGEAGAELGAAVRAALSSNTVFLPSGVSWRDAMMAANAAAAAAQTATARQSLRASDTRLQRLRDLQVAGGRSASVTDAANFAGRAGVETAIGVAQGNQLLGVMATTAARSATSAAQDEQIQRCQYARLAANAAAAEAAARAGLVQLVTNTSTVSCGTAASEAAGPGVSASTISYGLADGVTATAGGSGGSLDTMLRTDWGPAAASNAAALGVNPAALAATCVMESGCTANPGGSGTISGAFQMSNGTYAQTVAEVQASNPDLASQITSKNDPASQSIAASQYLLDAAQQQQAAGITPTVLTTRAYYQFGPGNSVALSTASDNALMADQLSGFSDTGKILRANGLNMNSTVGDWRQGIVNKLGGDASLPVLTTGDART
jgi:hypothetical protein